ncbi:MAG: hypothetical protein AAGI22_12285 [Planctomycetota bacterium]
MPTTRPNDRRRTRVLLALLGAVSAAALLVVAWSGGASQAAERSDQREPPRRIVRSSERPVEVPEGETIADAALDLPAAEVRRAEAAIEPEALAVGPATRTVEACLRVVDRSTGEPIAGATVSRVWLDRARLANVEKAGEAGWSVQPSGEDGVLRLTWPSSGERDVQARIEADRYVLGVVGGLGEDAGARAGATTDDVREASELLGGVRTVSLLRAARVLVEPLGFDADEGVAMLFEDGDARDRRPDEVERWNGEERVTFEGVEPGLVSVAMSVAGEPLVVRQSIAVGPGEDVVVPLEARRGETLRGRVVESSTRTPLEGIAVLARPALSGVHPDVEGAPFEKVLSAGDGSFEIDGVPPGKVLLKLVPPYGPSVDRTVTVIEGEGTRTRELGIPGSASIEGRVVAPDGASAAGIEVACLPASELRSLRIEGGDSLDSKEIGRRGGLVRADADGRFRFDAVPSGRTLAIVATGGGASGAVTLQPPRVGELRRGVEVALGPIEPATFRVADSDGRPVHAIDVSVRWALGPAGLWSPWKDEQSPDGAFQVEVDRQQVRRIRVRAEGFLPLDVSWPETEGVRAVQPTFTMTPALGLDVEVADANGLMVRGAWIVAMPSEYDDDPSSRTARRARRGSRTDSLGLASLVLDREGPWTLRTGRAGYVTQSRQVEVRPRGDSGSEGPREVFVLEPDEPPAPAVVEGTLVRWGTGGSIPAVEFDGLRGGSAEIDGATFRLVGIRPGSVSIVARPQGFESVRLPLDRLDPGEVRNVGEIRTRGATRLDVRVKGADGKPIRDARVRLVSRSPEKGGRAGLPRRLDFPRRADRTGAYRKSAVARVRWTLVVDRKGFKRKVTQVKVTGSRQTVEVTLERR